MDSIICPIIRYELFPMCCCPNPENMEREWEETYEEPGGYVLGYDNIISEDVELQQDVDNSFRCDAYKHIGPTRRKSFTREEAERIGRLLGIDWTKSKFDVEQFRAGLDVELEHGRRDMLTNVTNDDPILTGKIALAHLNELSDYYTRLKKMESEAMAHFGA